MRKNRLTPPKRFERRRPFTSCLRLERKHSSRPSLRIPSVWLTHRGPDVFTWRTSADRSKRGGISSALNSRGREHNNRGRTLNSRGRKEVCYGLRHSPIPTSGHGFNR